MVYKYYNLFERGIYTHDIDKEEEKSISLFRGDAPNFIPERTFWESLI